MRTLVYCDGRSVPAHLKEWGGRQDGLVEWRNGRLFERPEPRVDRVVTDLPDVREAYQKQDVEVISMPSPGQKNSASGRRYVPEDNGRWKKVYDREKDEYVDGASKRSMEEAQQVADKLNNA